MISEPIISSFYPDWLRHIAIKNDRSPFENSGFVDDFLLDASSDEALRASKSDPYPIPSTKDREYYHGEHHWLWWESGFDDFARIRSTAEKIRHRS